MQGFNQFLFLTKCALLFSLLFVSTAIQAQQLDAIGNRKPLTITGGVSLNQIVYAVDGIESRRDPYSLFTSGNINFDLYGWNVPLSFAYSNQQASFQQPFNQYSIHPTYKWVTGHIGFTSMNFSPYTLGGHLFLGAGVEARPGKWNVSAMYGRLFKAVEPDTLSESSVVPSFKRMGYGIKAGYADGNDQLHLIIFGAKDQLNSISYVPEEDNILPEENLVVSLIGSKQFLKSFVFNAEYAISGITRDTRSTEVDIDNNRFFANVGGLYTPRLSSAYYNAIKSGLSYQGNGFSVGVGYERIDPGYETLGAYFFNNDLVNYTVNAAAALFSGKVNISGNFGLQEDNLDGQKISTLKRNVGAITIGFAASEKLNLSTSYSNFTSFTNIRSQFVDINQLTPFDNLDTLNFTQISQNATFNGNYIIESAESRRQNLNMNLSFQDASDQQGGVEQNSGNQFYMVNSSYSLSFVPQNLTISTSFNYNENRSLNSNTRTLGPTLAVSKNMLDRKLRTTLSSSWNQSFNNGISTGRVLNIRANGGYSVKQKHNLNLSLAVVNRATGTENSSQEFLEFTGSLGYSYSFSSKKNGP